MAQSLPEPFQSLASEWASGVKTPNTSDVFVMGEIRPGAEILLVGEALGEEETKRKRPFVGKAGQRLDQAFLQAGLPRESVSITNVYPRRPLDAKGKNRAPTDEEIALNSPFLERLVALHPKLKAVGLLGGTALKWRTGQEGIKDYRGDEFRAGGLWHIPALHPSATLHAGSEFKWLVQDLKWMKTLASGDVLDATQFWFPLLRTSEEVSNLVAPIRQSKYAYVDMETGAQAPASPLWWWDPRVSPVLISFAWYEGDEPRAAVVEWNNDTYVALAFLLGGARPEYWCGSSALYFDFPLLRRLSMSAQAQKDTPLDSYPIAMLNDENRGCGLKDLAKQHLHIVGHTPYWGAAEEKEFHSKWASWNSMGQEEKDRRTHYAGCDAFFGVQCLSTEIQKLSTKKHLVKLYKDLVVWQARLVEEMNAEGMPLDLRAAERRLRALDRLIAYRSRKMQNALPDLTIEYGNCKGGKKKFTRMEHGVLHVCSRCGGTGRERWQVNFNSADQMDRLIKMSGLPPVKTPSGQIKTTPSGKRDAADKYVLLSHLDYDGWKEDEKVAKWIFPVLRGSLHVHEEAKMKGYVEALIEAVKVSFDHKVHATFKPGPVTWRLASEDPNEQQLPSRVKKLFVAPDGWAFVKHDENALEVRGLADQSGDPTLIKRIREGLDLHWVHYTGFVHKPYDTPKHKKKRHAFKTLLFASGYGAHPPKIALVMRDEFWTAGIGIDMVVEILTEHGMKREEITEKYKNDPYLALAEAWLAWLDQEYPNLRRSFLDMSARVAADGLVRSYFQAERRLPEIYSRDMYVRAEAERMAFNFPPQNLSMVTFLAYRRLDAERKAMGWERDVRYALQEHDSLMCLARAEIAGTWEAAQKSAMEEIDFSEWGSEFAVPLAAEGTVSRRWS